MQAAPDGRIPLERAIQILSFKKASSKKDLDRISRILDPGAVGSIPPSQLVRAALFCCCVPTHTTDRSRTSLGYLRVSMMRSTAPRCWSSKSMP